MSIITTKEELYAKVPATVAAEAMETLEAFDRVYITRQNGQWSQHAGIMLQSTYAPDSVLYEVHAGAVYSEKERNINYLNNFHEYPHGFRGNRDYHVLRSKFAEGHTVVNYDEDGTLYWL